MATRNRRAARIEVDRKGELPFVAVSVPRGISAGELQRVNEVLISDVIADLTGCPCLSGIIDVLYQHEYEKVIDVELPAEVG
jgi:hypothetical protein